MVEALSSDRSHSLECSVVSLSGFARCMQQQGALISGTPPRRHQRVVSLNPEISEVLQTNRRLAKQSPQEWDALTCAVLWRSHTVFGVWVGASRGSRNANWLDCAATHLLWTPTVNTLLLHKETPSLAQRVLISSDESFCPCKHTCPLNARRRHLPLCELHASKTLFIPACIHIAVPKTLERNAIYVFPLFPPLGTYVWES